MSDGLSEAAADLLHWARIQADRGNGGFAVAGLPEREAVEELVALGLVREEITGEVGYLARVYAVTP